MTDLSFTCQPDPEIDILLRLRPLDFVSRTGRKLGASPNESIPKQSHLGWFYRGRCRPKTRVKRG